MTQDMFLKGDIYKLLDDQGQTEKLVLDPIPKVPCENFKYNPNALDNILMSKVCCHSSLSDIWIDF